MHKKAGAKNLSKAQSKHQGQVAKKAVKKIKEKVHQVQNVKYYFTILEFILSTIALRKFFIK